jgi:hypothetical protein
LNLAAGDGMGFLPSRSNLSNAWAAWIGYQGEKEKLFIARTDARAPGIEENSSAPL